MSLYIKEMSIMHERTDEAFELGERLTVVGKKLLPGEVAPDFLLDYFDRSDSSIRQIRLADSAGRVRLLSVVNSLDTPVCQVETRQWEQLSKELLSDVCVYTVRRWKQLSKELSSGFNIYTVSMDLPFAQARWQSAEGVTHSSLSAHRSERFGEDYGVLIKEWRLLQRAVFVIDRQDRVAYAEYVADQMREPDYEAALGAALQTVRA
jgi:thioredoxin-dependent peroxiredoxin